MDEEEEPNALLLAKRILVCLFVCSFVLFLRGEEGVNLAKNSCGMTQENVEQTTSFVCLSV